MSWQLRYTKQAKKDANRLASAGLQKQAASLLALVAKDPWQTPPPYRRLVGDLARALSRRISYQHRVVYQVLPEQGVVKVLGLWSRYEQPGRSSRPRPSGASASG